MRSLLSHLLPFLQIKHHISGPFAVGWVPGTGSGQWAVMEAKALNSQCVMLSSLPSPIPLKPLEPGQVPGLQQTSRGESKLWLFVTRE